MMQDGGGMGKSAGVAPRSQRRHRVRRKRVGAQALSPWRASVECIFHHIFAFPSPPASGAQGQTRILGGAKRSRMARTRLSAGQRALFIFELCELCCDGAASLTNLSQPLHKFFGARMSAAF